MLCYLISVLIVAECNVNVAEEKDVKEALDVLIVAECNVNVATSTLINISTAF